MHTHLLRLIMRCAFTPAAARQAADPKPVFLYSRHFNAPGENRHLPNGNFQDLLERVAKKVSRYAASGRLSGRCTNIAALPASLPVVGITYPFSAAFAPG